MSKLSIISIVLLRISLGWYLLYWGIVAFTTEGWSIASLLENSDTFPEFYDAFSTPEMLNLLNTGFKIVLIAVGALLILGLFVRIVALIGAFIMLFLYFPLLKFPYVGTNQIIVNDYFIYAIALVYLHAARAGDYFSIKSLMHSRHHI
ncbi:MAG: DoxX family membrane protein [Patescibacteria group bacterium]